jgi:hypothetical protein
MVQILTASCEVECRDSDPKVIGNASPQLPRAGSHLAGAHVHVIRRKIALSHIAALLFRGTIANRLIRVYRQCRDSSNIVLGLLEEIVLCRARC